MINDKKIILLLYPRGAGGKFIVNCLGLSSNATLQSHNITYDQLNNGLTPADKFKIIIERLTKHNNARWTDLGLGCDMYFESWPDIGKVAKTANKNDLYSFKVCHNVMELTDTATAVPNAPIIYLTNSDKFINQCRPNYRRNNSVKFDINNEWNSLKGDSWPDHPPTSVEEYNALPEFIKDELRNLGSGTIFKYFLTDDFIKEYSYNNEPIYEWNCEWFFDEEQTVNKIFELYQLFGLTDFNPEWIKQYRALWLEKINK